MSHYDDASECPLCMEPLEADDFNFYPCSCGYQICRFCWHRIRTDENGRCPACRKTYSEDPAHFKPLTDEELVRIKKDRRLKDNQRKQKASDNKKHLADVRVVQKNLVFVVGISEKYADIEILRKHELFLRNGKVLKVVINQTTNYAGQQGPSASAYITYLKAEEALRTIQCVNMYQMDGRCLKASLGTTKYCSHFLRGTLCPKQDCMYLHDLGDLNASFSKEDMQLGKHQDYENTLHSIYVFNQTAPVPIARSPSNGRNINRNTPPEKTCKKPPSISHHSHSLVDIMDEQRNGTSAKPVITTKSPDCWVTAASVKPTDLPQLLSSFEQRNDNDKHICKPEIIANSVAVSDEVGEEISIATSSPSVDTAAPTKESRSNSESSVSDIEDNIRSALNLSIENCMQNDRNSVATEAPAQPPIIEPVHLYTADISELISKPNAIERSALSFFSHNYDSNVSKHSAGSTDNVTSSSEGSYASISPSEDQPIISDTMPVSHTTDWCEAFGFKRVQQQTEDELGFDPWNESNKALTDLIRGESAATHRSATVTNAPPGLVRERKPTHNYLSKQNSNNMGQMKHLTKDKTPLDKNNYLPNVATHHHKFILNTNLRQDDLGMKRDLEQEAAYMAGLANIHPLQRSLHQPMHHAPHPYHVIKDPPKRVYEQSRYTFESARPNDRFSNIMNNDFEQHQKKLQNQNVPDPQMNGINSLRDWQDGLRALLPNINISFCGNNDPNKMHNSQLPRSLMNNSIPRQTQQKGKPQPPHGFEPLSNKPPDTWINNMRAQAVQGTINNLNNVSNQNGEQIANGYPIDEYHLRNKAPPPPGFGCQNRADM